MRTPSPSGRRASSGSTSSGSPRLRSTGSSRSAASGSALLAHVGLLVVAFASALAAARSLGASTRSVCLVGLLCMFAAPWGLQLRAQTFAIPLFVWLLLAARSGQPSTVAPHLSRSPDSRPLGEPPRHCRPRGPARRRSRRHVRGSGASRAGASRRVGAANSAADRPPVRLSVRLAVRPRARRLLPDDAREPAHAYLRGRVGRELALGEHDAVLRRRHRHSHAAGTPSLTAVRVRAAGAPRDADRRGERASQRRLVLTRRARLAAAASGQGALAVVTPSSAYSRPTR